MLIKSGANCVNHATASAGYKQLHFHNQYPIKISDAKTSVVQLTVIYGWLFGASDIPALD